VYSVRLSGTGRCWPSDPPSQSTPGPGPPLWPGRTSPATDRDRSLYGGAGPQRSTPGPGGRSVRGPAGGPARHRPAAQWMARSLPMG